MSGYGIGRTYGADLYGIDGPGPTTVTIDGDVAWGNDPDDASPTFLPLDVPSAATPHPVESITVARGRSYEKDDAQIGEASLGVANPGGDFTPDNSAGQWYPNVDLDKRMRVRVTPPAPYDTTYSLFDGHINSLPTDVDAQGFDNGEATLGGLDYFEVFGVVDLLSAYDHEVISSGPLAFYPMSDDTGSDTVGNAAATGATSGVLKYRGTYGGQYKLGGVAMLAADDSTSLELTCETTSFTFFGVTTYNTVGGWQVDLAAGSSPAFLDVAGGYTVELVASVAGNLIAGGSFIDLFSQYGPNGMLHIRVQVSDTYVELITGYDAGGVSANIYVLGASTAMADGLPHHIVATLSTDGKTGKIYVDGVLIETTVSATAANFEGAPVSLVVGGGVVSGAIGGTFMSGRIGKVALYDRPLTGTEIARHNSARGGFTGELSGARISRILDYAGFPAGRRTLDDGESICGPLLSRKAYALDLLQNVRQTEQGVVFMDGDGNFVFKDRARTRNTVSRVTLGTTTLPVETDGMRFDLDKSRVMNVINASRPNGPTVRVEDQASIDRHRKRVQNITYEVSTDAEMVQAAKWDLFLYGDPRVRMSTVVLDPFTAPALWPWALGLEIGDRITISNLPVYAPATSLDFIVQHIAHAGAVGSWQTTLLLSPVVVATLRADAAPSTLTVLDGGLVIAY